MTSRKRRASGDAGEPLVKNPRLDNEESNPDQLPSNPNSNLSQKSNDYVIKVTTRSTSKALRNDYIHILARRERLRKAHTEWSAGKSDAGQPLHSGSPAISQNASDHHADALVDEAKTNFDVGDVVKTHADNSLENLSPTTVKSEDSDKAASFQEETVAETQESRQIDRERFENDDNSEDEDNFDDEENYDDQDNSEDEDASENDSNFEFEWLEPIDVEVLLESTLDGGKKPAQIAYCNAKLIRRNQIRDEFYSEMEQPSRETSMLAFDLFDRYGRLRSEFKTHPIIKGSGVWQEELDNGDMLLIEQIFVDQAHRRQRLGQKMMEALVAHVRQKTRAFFAFVWPTILNLHDIDLEWKGLENDAARKEMGEREENRAVAFCRSLGFRRVGSTIWFAMTLNNQHPSRKLASAEDFTPLKEPLTALHHLLRPFQRISNPPAVSFEQILRQQPQEDPDYLSVLHDCHREKGSADECWMSRDKGGNTVLHLAVEASQLSCIEWILSHDFGTRLLQIRNCRGETPLELLQFKLEKLRTQKAINDFTASMSDKFKGHGEIAMHALLMLKQLGSLESFVEVHGHDALQRMDQGCTCGQCLRGFLSPRMSRALLVQAELGSDAMDLDIHTHSGPEWVVSNEVYLGYLPSEVLNNLNTNKSMRQGFINLWDHIATCLKMGDVPCEQNVLAALRGAHEWPPATRNFLQRGGTVESAFLAICRAAMQYDKVVGDGLFQRSGDMENDLPECRNDLEFGFVSGTCGYRRISLQRNVDMRGNTLDEDFNIVDSLY